LTPLSMYDKMKAIVTSSKVLVISDGRKKRPIP
jgi:hypothetical protein